jgi:hypothetical protein
MELRGHSTSDPRIERTYRLTTVSEVVRSASGVANVQSITLRSRLPERTGLLDRAEVPASILAQPRYSREVWLLWARKLVLPGMRTSSTVPCGCDRAGGERSRPARCRFADSHGAR